jgi:hypothetical protein
VLIRLIYLFMVRVFGWLVLLARTAGAAVVVPGLAAAALSLLPVIRSGALLHDWEASGPVMATTCGSPGAFGVGVVSRWALTAFGGQDPVGSG